MLMRMRHELSPKGLQLVAQHGATDSDFNTACRLIMPENGHAFHSLAQISCSAERGPVQYANSAGETQRFAAIFPSNKFPTKSRMYRVFKGGEREVVTTISFGLFSAARVGVDRGECVGG